MATVIDQIAIALELDPSKLAAGIKKAAKNVDTGTKKMAGRFESLKKNVFNLRSAFTGLVGAYVVRDFITKSNAQEEAVSRLIATLKKEGIYTEALSASLQELASDIQGVTTEGDELTLSNIALMQNLGHLAEDQIPDATRAAIGLAKVMGVDSTTAFKLLGRAASGNSDMFTRYGITLDKTLSDQEKFNELLRIGADGFQLAEAEAKTGAGAIKQFGNLVGDLKEKLGDLIKEALMPVLKVLKHVVVFFNDMDAATRKAIVALVAFAAVIYKVVVPALTALHLSAGPIGWILMGIATAVAGGILVWDKYTASTRKTEQAAKSLEKTLQDLKSETVSVEAAFQQYLETKKRLGESVSVEMPKMPATAESLFGEPEIIKIHTDVDEVVLLRHELDTLAKQIEDARRLEAVGEEIPDLDAWEKLYAEKKGRLNKYIRETEDRLKAHQERLEGQEKLRADLAVKNIADQYDREREKVTQWSEKKFGIAEGNTEIEAAVR